jgi:F-type H+-transporting ATPase subunit a
MRIRPIGATLANEPVPVDPQVQPEHADDEAQFGSDKRSRLSMRTLGIMVGILLIVDVLAIIFVPPANTANPEESCAYPVCFIEGSLHLPRPHEMFVLGKSTAEANTGLITFEVSLTDSLITMMGLTFILIVLMILASRGRSQVPGFFQNFVEWGYEGLNSFGRSMGGPKAERYIPLFASFFILILTFNWFGLLPIAGNVEGLRAPTSDLNVTAGLAMVAFFVFHVEGFRRLGGRGYLSKFFPVYEFKNGIGAGLIAMFVGFVELFLEFIKPVTLSMRLFGNIFGGEVALAVVTALFVALIPVALYGLEVMLTFIQALIFSTLTLMFILAAVESHHHEEGEMGEEAMEALGDATHPEAATT